MRSAARDGTQRRPRQRALQRERTVVAAASAPSTAPAASRRASVARSTRSYLARRPVVAVDGRSTPAVHCMHGAQSSKGRQGGRGETGGGERPA
eukprot:365940-Chlamydomonas_euryale.AAC.14